MPASAKRKGAHKRYSLGTYCPECHGSAVEVSDVWRSPDRGDWWEICLTCQECGFERRDAHTVTALGDTIPEHIEKTPTSER